MTRSINRHTASVLAVATLGLLITSTSHAYLDPGTGSIILQGLLASLAVGIGLLRHYWQQCKTFVTKLTNGSRNGNSDSEQELEQTSNIQTKS